LAASAVLVICLGDPEKFTTERLPEVGAALVEALATFGIRDAATILHGAGSAGIPHERAAELFADGLLAALGQVPDADYFRELLIVEREAKAVPDIERGIAAAHGSARVHVYIESTELRPRTTSAGDAPPRTVPEHLRVGITRAGTQLKVTVIGHGAYDCVADTDYPAELSQTLVDNLQAQVITEPDGGKRATALESLGEQLYRAFLKSPALDLQNLLEGPQAQYVVLRLDRATAFLPWETLYLQDAFLSRTRVLARQLEAQAPGRQAPLPALEEGMKALVVGDPKDDLPAAKNEARAVVDALKQLPGVDVDELIGDVSYLDLSQQLDTTNYDILHYAGHARSDRRGSGLVLKDAASPNDATLTAEDLSTRRFLPQLIFANACNSAQAGDGIDSFRGAQATRDLVGGALRAGVRTFIGSAWAVDDDVAATFAAQFYKAVITPDENGRRAPVGEAIRLAREAVVAQHGPEAHGWAGYALYGSPWLPVVDIG
jgi:CHAT domain-containing protein